MEAGVDANLCLNINFNSDDSLTPIGVAIEEEHLEVVVLLLQHGADVNIACRTPAMESPLHMAAGEWNVGIMQVLLDHGAEADAVTDEGRTPLHYATEGRLHAPVGCQAHFKALALLLRQDVDVNAEDSYGFTPICHEGRELKITRLLLEHGADVTPKDSPTSPLHVAAIYGKVPVYCCWNIKRISTLAIHGVEHHCIGLQN